MFEIILSLRSHKIGLQLPNYMLVIFINQLENQIHFFVIDLMYLKTLHNIIIIINHHNANDQDHDQHHRYYPYHHYDNRHHPSHHRHHCHHHHHH